MIDSQTSALLQSLQMQRNRAMDSLAQTEAALAVAQAKIMELTKTAEALLSKDTVSP